MSNTEETIVNSCACAEISMNLVLQPADTSPAAATAAAADMFVKSTALSPIKFTSVMGARDRD